MRTLTINLTEEAYQVIRSALEEHVEGERHSVSSWLETELNDNTETIVEMLLGDF